MTSVANDIDAFLAGHVARVAALDEAAWHTHWHAEELGALSPVRMAVRGGMMARSMPHVFVAGYQAALRTVFPELPAKGWAAFVAAEDRADPENHPGTVLTDTADGLRMSGYKSWVGQSRHVEQLLVSAKQNGEDHVVSVVRDAPGLTLTHRESPSFLSGLSQGFAQFDDTPATLVAGADMRAFGRTEPKFVMLAGAAFLLAEAEDDATRTRATSLTMALASYAASGDWAPKLLAALDRELQALATDHSGAGIPDWQADRRLFAMYSPRIQKRA
jgi:hypothetical protein